MLIDGVDVQPLSEVVVGHLMKVLRLAKGNQRQAAAALGITRWSLSRKLKKHNLGTDGYPLVQQAS